MPRTVSPLLLLAASLMLAGGAAFAADRGQLPESVSRIERETGARVLSAQRSLRDGREMNRIKVITPEGRVRVMWDEPRRPRSASGAPFPPRAEARGLRPVGAPQNAGRDAPSAPARDDG